MGKRGEAEPASPPSAGASPVRPQTAARLGAYLRRLREGYGYTLRKVEEQALALGEPIDNSQLSRFEKGKATPSFEKLRALAHIFNVPVQNFADILDLEAYAPYKPQEDDFDALLHQGSRHARQGDHGRAFVTFERALEVAEARRDDPDTCERILEARWRMVGSLWALGKLSLAESELRQLLRERGLTPDLRRRTLMLLSYVYHERGDRYLASVVARECLDLAIEQGDVVTQCRMLNTLANIAYDEGDYERALAYYTRTAEVLGRSSPQPSMRLTVSVNRGGCLVALQRFHEGVRAIRSAYAEAVRQGFRRVAALAMNRLAEAYAQQGDGRRAHDALAEADRLAARPEGSYHDILFMNAYVRWQLARGAGNATRERIAFGRLRHLRPFVERRLPEVEAFDRYVERHRREHA